MYYSSLKTRIINRTYYFLVDFIKKNNTWWMHLKEFDNHKRQKKKPIVLDYKKKET